MGVISLAGRRPRAAHSRMRLALAGLALAAACSQPAGNDGRPAGVANPPDPKEREATVFSGPFTVDRIFPSMQGPYTTSEVQVMRSPERELVWLTGLKVDVANADGTAPESIEYECHSNLVWPNDAPAGTRRPVGNVFTLTQGQVDLRLPPGFGLPVFSDERVFFNSQVLNLNRPNDNREVRHIGHVRYVRDKDLTAPMKPLVVAGAYVMASLENEATLYNVASDDPKLAEASCHAGTMPRGIPAKAPFIITDQHNRRFTGHWLVTPGRHVYRTLVTDLLALPYDTTAHFIAVHVHPYSESLELRDVTANATVWTSYQRTSKDRIGLDWIDYYSSAEGLPLYKDHQYELISTYDNRSTQDSDAMASIFVYYLDKEFRRPEPGA